MSPDTAKCPLGGQAALVESPQLPLATLQTELFATCCMVYKAKSCPKFHVTPSLEPGRAELPEHKAIIVGPVCLSKDGVVCTVPGRPSPTRQGPVSGT